MASYEYEDIYYDVYYLFVTDTDTGSGAEGTPTVKELVSSSDTGSGTEGVATVKQAVSSADTGHGTDAGESIHASLSSTDTASGTDLGAVIQRASSTDTGAATDAQVSVAVSDGDISAAIEVDPISDTDTGSFSDVPQSFSFNDVDTFAATDIEGNLHLADTESGLFVELLNWFITVKSADTGTGTEFSTGGKQIIGTDTGAGIDAQHVSPGALDADAGSFTESSSILATGVIDEDALSADDEVVSLNSPVSSSDTAHGTDVTAAPNIMSADTNTTVVEAVTKIGITSVNDTGGVNPITGEVGAFPNDKFDADHGTTTEASSIHVTLSSADAGGSAHQVDWQQGEQEHVRIPEQTDMMFESFSISHTAVLNGTTGAEAASVYGCRAGTVTLNFNEYDNSADDILIGAWYDATTANVQVDAAFLSWAAVQQFGGDPASTDGTHFGFSVWQEYMSTLPAVPVLLRAPSKDAYGNSRTIDIVLYRVQMRSFSIDSMSYKNGITFSYSGIAKQSTTDEIGTPLPSAYWSNATGYSLGRIISSPGTPQVSVLAGSLYGDGT